MAAWQVEQSWLYWAAVKKIIAWTHSSLKSIRQVSQNDFGLMLLVGWLIWYGTDTHAACVHVPRKINRDMRLVYHLDRMFSEVPE